ncbi:hypothetical protein M2346_000394 [Sphingobium xanthum]|nr:MULTISPECIES: hypothetical protein [Sphingobium]MCW2362945.1 hypothetical protein [Sphingobium sp. B10D3B]MCW2400375.1 hypothetical protein [Sphingobium sp. B10D7B]MCW2407353.1 hypothetical protein [Sphingobium xanthum]
MISGSSEQLRLEWQESKGDSAPPGDHQGFGSDLIRLSIERQLRGTFVREWLPRGLKVTTTIPYRLQAA